MAKHKKNTGTPGTTSANVGYEAQLWQMADALRGQLLIYRDGSLNLQVRLDGQTVWLTREATIRSFRIVQREGARDVAVATKAKELGYGG